MCEVLSDAGFFSGLWHGLVAVFSLLADIFWEVEVYDHCQQSWWYDFGFILGLIFLGIFALQVSVIVVPILFLAWLVAVTFKYVILGFAVGVGLLLAFLGYEWFKRQYRF